MNESLSQIFEELSEQEIKTDPSEQEATARGTSIQGEE